MRHVLKFASGMLMIVTMQVTNAQQSGDWNGKKCAVVLTYDDALQEHLDYVIPALDSAGLQATFYLTGESPVVGRNIPAWRIAAGKGHELGNHTLRHPCDGRLPGRSWLSPEMDLSKYSVDRAIKEITITNSLLQAIDGKPERTFAYPCGDEKIDTVAIYPLVQDQFLAARGVKPGLESPAIIHYNNINCFSIAGQDGAYMIELVNRAIKEKKLLVFLFHGVGSDYSLNVSKEAHRQLVEYLRLHEAEIWVAPMVDVVRFIKK
ncbi:MAG: polysaccharide deacetylase family protein [Chitinophagaceae bacterium]